jgi:hypothetical protein
MTSVFFLLQNPPFGCPNFRFGQNGPPCESWLTLASGVTNFSPQPGYFDPEKIL